jgi:hypothetical protein
LNYSGKVGRELSAASVGLCKNTAITSAGTSLMINCTIYIADMLVCVIIPFLA